MSKRYEMIANFPIFFDQIYFLAYTGGYRELTKDQQKQWDKTLSLPGELQIKEKKKIGLHNNPNVVPIKGMDLLACIKEMNFVPFFDANFQNTHLLKLTNLIIYESIKAKSYEMAIKHK